MESQSVLNMGTKQWTNPQIRIFFVIVCVSDFVIDVRSTCSFFFLFSMISKMCTFSGVSLTTLNKLLMCVVFVVIKCELQDCV